MNKPIYVSIFGVCSFTEDEHTDAILNPYIDIERKCSVIGKDCTLVQKMRYPEIYKALSAGMSVIFQ